MTTPRVLIGLSSAVALGALGALAVIRLRREGGRRLARDGDNRATATDTQSGAGSLVDLPIDINVDAFLDGLIGAQSKHLGLGFGQTVDTDPPLVVTIEFLTQAEQKREVRGYDGIAGCRPEDLADLFDAGATEEDYARMHRS